MRAARHLLRATGAVATMTLVQAAVAVDVLPAHADTCPDVYVVFARGTGVAPGIGDVGQMFVDALKPKVAGRTLDVYAVDYPASPEFATSSKKGADDASARVQSMAASCPATRMVLGGYSQGAGVIDWASTLMPAQTADHVAAVALFGNPSTLLATALSGGYPPISPLYRQKTIDLCAPGDPACSVSLNPLAHISYLQSGLPAQAATFVAGRL